jgi:DNA-binding transcriptional ArsR family regulator
VSDATRAQADDVCADLHVLAEQHRLLILRNLRRGARPAGFLADAVGISPSLASHHLSVLMDAGLVTRRVQGQFACYAVERDRLQDMHRRLGIFAGALGAAVEELDAEELDAAELGPCRV